MVEWLTMNDDHLVEKSVFLSDFRLPGLEFYSVRYVAMHLWSTAFDYPMLHLPFLVPFSYDSPDSSFFYLFFLSQPRFQGKDSGFSDLKFISSVTFFWGGPLCVGILTALCLGWNVWDGRIGSLFVLRIAGVYHGALILA